MKEVQAKRSPGLDLLRILSMGLVILLHLLGRGGVLSQLQPGTWHYALGWGIETAAYCAVDCYALLTGYLLIRSRCRLSSLLGTWVQVFFYSAGITLLFAIFYEQVPLPRFLQSCLPVTFTQYWYFTAYFAVYCFAPFLNRMIEGLSQDAFRRLLGTALLLLSLLPGITKQDPFVTGEGYSFLWLAVLYLLGAYLRLYPGKVRKARWGFGLYVLCVAGLMASRFLLDAWDVSRGAAPTHGGWLLTYTSPLVLGAALGLFLCCRRLESVPRPIAALIRFFAPVSFGVYLIHAQPFVFHRLLNGAVVPLLALPAWQFALELLGIAAAIFLVCALIDYLRLLLFRLLRIPTLCERIGNALEAKLPKI